MATRREIENLLKNVNVTIGIEEVSYVFGKYSKLKMGRTIEEYLLENAECIDFKKLLVLVIHRLQDLSTRYIGVSKKLEEDNRKEVEKAMTFAKRYIKPEEIIKVFIDTERDGKKGFTLIDSRITVYGQDINEENEKFDKIKTILPNIENKELESALREALEDEFYGMSMTRALIGRILKKQRYFLGENNELLQDKNFEKTIELADNGILNENLREFLEMFKSHVNADKYVLYHAHRLNQKLEERKDLTEDEERFLNAVQEIVKTIDEKEKIKLDEKHFYGIRESEKFISQYNAEKQEYYTKEQIDSGEILLKETNGYEEYCSKDQLRKLAQKEENLLYLAQRKKLNNATVYTIATNYPVSEETLVGLYQCGAFTLKRVEAYAKQKDMDFNSIKEKIKQQKFADNQNIDLNNEETWELLTPEERLQMTVEGIESGKKEKIQGRIEELYDIQEIADLYKEIYHEDEQSEEQNEELQEKRKKYESLITLHNALGMQDRDDIVNILEDELSNEMLMNLYSDHVISMDILESYGEKELVMEAFNQGRLHERDMREAIIRYPISLEEQQIYQYYQQGILIPRDILDLYISDRINLDTIKRINEKLPEEQKIDLELKEEEVANLYQNAKKEKKRKHVNNDIIVKYKRYGLLYQTLKRENLNEEKKLESDKKILEHMTDVTQEDIMELYKDNLLILETVLQQGGNDLVKKLTLQGDLRTNDARTYFESEKEKASIEEILQNPDMDETEKLILIYTTYGDNVKKREKLVKNYISAYASDIKGENTTTRKKKEEEEGLTSGKNTVTDPYQRWKLLALLDKNYSRKYVGGYLIVKLHNTQKAIIEKLYGKKYGEVEPGYNASTFCLATEEYEKLEPELIRDKDKGKRFDIAKLRKEARNHPEIITKVTHHSARYDEKGNEKNSWVKRLLQYVCDEEPEKVYTEEELKQISECSKAIENSRKEIER